MKPKSRYLRWSFLFILLASLALVGACGDDEADTTATTAATGDTGSGTEASVPLKTGKDKIVIGAARPLSGPLAFFEANAFGPIYKMWVEEVNKDGGIMVAEYGKKLPVEMKVYDDQSNLDTSTRLMEKLIKEDKVDFLFAPTSTAFLFAAAGVANANKYILMSAEGGATSLEKEIANLPYFFQVLSYSNHYQIPELAKILEEQGVKTVGIIYIDDLHGIEYSGVAEEELPKVGVEILFNEAVPPDIKDMSALLKRAQEANPDGLLLFAYPDQNFLAIGQMMQLKYSPKLLLLGPGGSYTFFPGNFGDAVADGVMAEGAWSINSSPEAKEFYDKLVAYMGNADNIDFWGHLLYWAELQFFQQAIEKAGTLDQDKIAEVMKTEHFQTVLGDTFFTNQILDASAYPGQIGQWQNGTIEVIDVGEKRTAAPVYPKPDWPAPTTATTAAQ